MNTLLKIAEEQSEEPGFLRRHKKKLLAAGALAAAAGGGLAYKRYGGRGAPASEPLDSPTSTRDLLVKRERAYGRDGRPVGYKKRDGARGRFTNREKALRASEKRDLNQNAAPWKSDANMYDSFHDWLAGIRGD